MRTKRARLASSEKRRGWKKYPAGKAAMISQPSSGLSSRSILRTRYSLPSLLRGMTFFVGTGEGQDGGLGRGGLG